MTKPSKPRSTSSSARPSTTRKQPLTDLFRYRPLRGQEAAEILIIADAPTRKDFQEGVCFNGDSTFMLIQELEKVGILFHECAAMTCLDYCPPGGKPETAFHTKTEAKKDPDIRFVNGKYVKPRVLANAKRVWETIDRLQPSQILCLGTVALWMLTGKDSLLAHRGSMLYVERPWGSARLLPTYHPVAAMRQVELKHVFRRDLTRFVSTSDSGWAMPSFNFGSERPTFEEIVLRLSDLHDRIEGSSVPIPLGVDIETRIGLTTVLGIAYTDRNCIVIPLTSVARSSYFTPENEFLLMRLVEQILIHKNSIIVGQNFHYDQQYLIANYGIRSTNVFDTMSMAHMRWQKGLPLSLDFLASMLCRWYRYWKSDGKDFHKSIEREQDELIYWRYNGYDCCYTLEIYNVLLQSVADPASAVPFAFQRAMQDPLLDTMLRGTRFDSKAQASMRKELALRIRSYERWFQSLPISDLFEGTAGAPWYNSAHKLKKYFYEFLNMEPIRNKSTKRPTTNQLALETIAKREPVLKLVCDRLIEYSSMNQFLSLYLNAQPSDDGRMRCMYGLAGTDTFRLNSKADAFGRGMNLQNLSKGNS